MQNVARSSEEAVDGIDPSIGVGEEATCDINLRTIGVNIVDPLSH